MRMTEIAAQNLYGHVNVEAKLGPVTVIAGPNEAGKTSLLTAIEIATNGTRRASDYGPDWTVAAAFVDDELGNITVRRGPGLGEVTIGDGLAAKRITGVRKVDKWLGERLGHASRFDLAGFMARTRKARLTWIEEHVLDGGGWTWSRFIESTGEPCVVFHPRADENGRQAAMRLHKVVDDAHREADSQAKRLHQVIQDLRLAQDHREELPPGNVSLWKREQRVLRSERAELERKLGAEVERDAQRKRLRESIEVTDEQLRALDEERQAGGDEGQAGGVSQVRAKLERRGENLTRVAARLVEVDEAIETAKVESEKAHRVEEAAVNEQAEAWRRSSAALAAVEVEEVRLNAVEKAQGLLLAARALARWTTAQGVDLPQTVSEAVAIVQEWAQLESGDTLSDAREAHAKAEAAQREAETKRRAAQTRHHAARRRAGAAEESKAAAAAEQERLRQLVREAEQQLAQLAQQRETRGERRELWQSQRRKMQAELDELGTDASTVHREAMTQIDAQIDALEVHINVATDYVAADARLTEAIEEEKHAEARRLELHRYRASVSDTLGVMLKEQARPLVQPVSRITEATLGATFGVELTNGFDYHLLRDGLELGHGSTSCDAVAAAALQLSVADQLGGWRGVLVDGLEALETDRRDAFLAALVQASLHETTEPLFDNVILALVWDRSRRPSVPRGTDVVLLERT